MNTVVDSNATITIGVRHPTTPSLGRRLVLWLGTHGIGWDRDDWLVAVNQWGATIALFRVSSPEEAASKKKRLESEIEALGTEAFSDRYKIPGGFITPEWSARDIPAQ